MSSVSLRYRRYLVFSVGPEEYGMPIDRIQEIVGYMPVIPFTDAHGLFQGIINLNDEIIPVIDLRITMRDSNSDVTSRTCIIVAYILVEDEELLIGVVVDGVCEVLEAPESMMEEKGFLFSASQTPHLSWGSSSGRPSSVFFPRNGRF